MAPFDAAEWREKRKKGRDRYVWVRTGIVTLVLETIFQLNFAQQATGYFPEFMRDQPTLVPLFAVLAWAWAAWSWKRNEAAFAASEDEPPPDNG